MSSIFTLDNFDDFSEKINIDELYEKKRESDLKKLETYKKILNRIHVRIKTTARMTPNDKFCWYLVPEIIIGVPKYDQSACIAYLMDTLNTNGFQVKYYHPNTILICWDHWVPTYVRNEIKKKTGIKVNEFGEKIVEEDEENKMEEKVEEKSGANKQKTFTPIRSYKPSGNLVYSNDLLNKMENTFTNSK